MWFPGTKMWFPGTKMWFPGTKMWFPEHKCDSLELLRVNLKSFSKRAFVALCYRPPDAENDFLHNLNAGFVKATINSNIKDIIFLGDFNFPNIQWANGWGFAHTSSETIFTDMLQENSFFPTRKPTNAWLKYTWPNPYDQWEPSRKHRDCRWWSFSSDHKAIVFDIHLRRKPKKLPEKTVYSYNKGDFAALREPLEVQPLIGIVLSKVDIDITWTKWSNTSLLLWIHFVIYPKKENLQILYPTLFCKRDCSPPTSKRNNEKTSKEAGFCRDLGEQRKRAKTLIKSRRRNYFKNVTESYH